MAAPAKKKGEKGEFSNRIFKVNHFEFQFVLYRTTTHPSDQNKLLSIIRLMIFCPKLNKASRECQIISSLCIWPKESFFFL